MRYESIEFNNFRQFKETKFTFDKDINLIVANNSSGKSTLMAGLIFGLYGIRKLRDSKLLKGTDIIVNLDNVIKAEKPYEFKNHKATVVVVVNIGGNKRYKITRVLNNTRYLKEIGHNGEAYDTSSFEDCKVEEIKNVGSDVVSIDVIHNRIPTSIAPLLFFDGERIKNINEVLNSKKISGKNGFKYEVERILKVTELEEGEKLLKKALDELKGQVVKDANTEELSKIEFEIKKTADTLEKRLKMKSENTYKLEVLDNNIADIEQKLRESEKVKNLQIKRDRLQQDLLNLNNDIQQEKKIILGNILLKGKNLSWKLSFLSLYEKTKKEDTAKVVRGIEQPAIDDILCNEICICGTPVTSQMEQHLSHMRNYLPPESFEAALKSYITHYENLEDEIELIMSNQMSTVEKIARKNKLMDEIKVVGNQITSEGAPDIIDLENRLAKIKRERDVVIGENANNDRQIEMCEVKERTLSSKSASLRKSNIENDLVNEKIDLVEEARSYVKEYIKNRKLEIKKDLQKNVNLIAKDLVRESINITLHDSLTPAIKTKTGTDSVSTGIDVMISISYLLGLIETAKGDMLTPNMASSFKEDKTNFPIVMDGVTATLDRGHIDNMVDKILTTNTQAIFLVNDQTITVLRESIEDKLKLVELDQKIHCIIREKDTNIAIVKGV